MTKIVMHHYTSSTNHPICSNFGSSHLGSGAGLLPTLATTPFAQCWMLLPQPPLFWAHRPWLTNNGMPFADEPQRWPLGARVRGFVPRGESDVSPPREKGRRGIVPRSESDCGRLFAREQGSLVLGSARKDGGVNRWMRRRDATEMVDCTSMLRDAP